MPALPRKIKERPHTGEKQEKEGEGRKNHFLPVLYSEDLTQGPCLVGTRGNERKGSVHLRPAPGRSGKEGTCSLLSWL